MGTQRLREAYGPRDPDSHEVLAKSRINGCLMATPAVTGKGTFIRTDTHLVRYE